MDGMELVRTRRLPRWWPYAAAGAAAVALLLAGALAAGAFGARGGGQAFSATVVPPAANVQVPSGSNGTSGATSLAGAPAAGDVAPATADLRDRAAAAPGQAASYPQPVFGASCSASPTVQFQGRGLAATGTASITVTEQVGSVNVTVQQTGGDAAAVLAAVQARIAAVRDALARAGVPATNLQLSYYRTYGDPQGRQFSAYATLQATVTGADALAEATRAVAQLAGVTAYSTSSPIAGHPTQQQVQDAVGRAAAQAREMAASTAAAAGVGLGDVQSVVAQPPVTCYGPTGPERVVQVTVTYAVR